MKRYVCHVSREEKSYEQAVVFVRAPSGAKAKAMLEEHFRENGTAEDLDGDIIEWSFFDGETNDWDIYDVYKTNG